MGALLGLPLMSLESARFLLCHLCWVLGFGGWLGSVCLTLKACLPQPTQHYFHPTVDQDGNVCISILHEPGEDKWGYERAEERWLPVHTVETILISVISMLADPNDESPANVDAAVRMWVYA